MSSPGQSSATATVSVPAGDYAISGTGQLEALGGGGGGGCSLTADGSPLGSDTSSGTEFVDLPGGQLGSVSDQAIAHLSAPGTIGNSCTASGAVVMHDAVTAIKVGTATP